LWVFVWGIEDLDLYRYYVFVFVVVVVVSIILGMGDRMQEREKKKKRLFNALVDEQLLLQLKELLFICLRISAEWGDWCYTIC
jgi:hypothetical protein